MNIFEKFPYLNNDKVIIKKMMVEDEELLAKLKSEKEVYRYEPSFLPELLFDDDKEFIVHGVDNLLLEKNDMILGIYLVSDPNTLVGICELYGYVPKREKISIGYRLMKEYWHQGIASDVVSLLKDYIFNDLELTKITAHVIKDNVGSTKALIKNGFSQRRLTHYENWGLEKLVLANKYVIYLR